jgi:hypothetical protein
MATSSVSPLTPTPAAAPAAWTAGTRNDVVHSANLKPLDVFKVQVDAPKDGWNTAKRLAVARAILAVIPPSSHGKLQADFSKPALFGFHLEADAVTVAKAGHFVVGEQLAISSTNLTEKEARPPTVRLRLIGLSLVFTTAIIDQAVT